MKRALLALLAVVAGVVGGAGPAVAPAGAAPCAAGALRVAMVVDFGDGATVTSTCVGVNSGDNAADALVARAELLGTRAPQFQNGLVCAIDGYPNLDTKPCAASNGDGTYAYWSYWHGTDGRWAYSSVGATYRVQADVVEGWRYLPHGADSGSLPAPNGSAVATAICVPDAPPSTDGPGPTVAPVPGDPGDAPSGGAGGVASTATRAPGAATESSTTTTTTSATVASGRASPGDSTVVTIAASGRGSSSGGSPVGLVVAVVLVVALGAGGALVIRRRAPSGA